MSATEERTGYTRKEIVMSKEGQRDFDQQTTNGSIKLSKLACISKARDIGPDPELALLSTPPRSCHITPLTAQPIPKFPACSL